MKKLKEDTLITLKFVDSKGKNYRCSTVLTKGDTQTAIGKTLHFWGHMLMGKEWGHK